ncbi:uncharacterized protein LOC135386879 [Ornithodoros turicata]|uniref:uncharacterized protein LOC135386879 n=1 Tax=Ornithodoros turicata TaxID=34597 RepID=UPI0031386FE8
MSDLTTDEETAQKRTKRMPQRLLSSSEDDTTEEVEIDDFSDTVAGGSTAAFVRPPPPRKLACRDLQPTPPQAAYREKLTSQPASQLHVARRDDPHDECRALQIKVLDLLERVSTKLDDQMKILKHLRTDPTSSVSRDTEALIALLPVTSQTALRELERLLECSQKKNCADHATFFNWRFVTKGCCAPHHQSVRG